MEAGLCDSKAPCVDCTTLLNSLYKRMTEPLKIKRSSMYNIYSTMKKARMDVLDYMSVLHGAVPDAMILSKSSYMLTYVYNSARGMFSSGFWLQLPVAVQWDCGIPNDRVVLVDPQNKPMGWYDGGELCYITEKHVAEMNRVEAELKVLLVLKEGVEREQKRKSCSSF